MIEKQDFYHGAALLRLVVDDRCKSIQARHGGYVVNESMFVLIKYSTRAHSPWRFTLTEDETWNVSALKKAGCACFIALVCGGDGFCAMRFDNLSPVLGQGSGWLSAKRRFSESYAVAGPLGRLKNKVALNQWPEILFAN